MHRVLAQFDACMQLRRFSVAGHAVVQAEVSCYRFEDYESEIRFNIRPLNVPIHILIAGEFGFTAFYSGSYLIVNYQIDLHHI